MDRQAFAISILEQARDILSRRLVERVIDARDEILEDARGESFLGEIEALHEQIGARLGHVSQILANLPPSTYDVAAPAFQEDDDWTPASPAHLGAATAAAAHVDMAIASGSPGAASEYSAASEYIAANWPSSTAGRPHESPLRSAAITLLTVCARIQTGELDAASRLLAGLFDLTPARGERCAEFFADRAASYSDCLSRVSSLRQLLESGQRPSAAQVLQDCFGLSATECQRALDLLVGHERF
jgi:hypothetical protein